MFRKFSNRVGPVALLLCTQLYTAKANPQTDMVKLMSEQQKIKNGSELFMRHCSGCHGTDALGRGPASQFLHPKPRNLVEGVFKFKSTPMGSLPTKADLLKTLERGLVGSSMPSFKFLPSDQREAIVAYVMSLRPGWNNQNVPILALPYPPESIKTLKGGTFYASALRGKTTYGELCLSCHGDTGIGDGPASEGIFDAENEPLKPANLRRLHLKAGSGSRDIFRTISTGIEGTPMPPFEEVLTPEKRWDVVAYVLYLRGEENKMYPEGFSLEKAVSAK